MIKKIFAILAITAGFLANAVEVEVKQLKTAALKGKDSYILQVELTTEKEGQTVEEFVFSLKDCDKLSDVSNINVLYGGDIYHEHIDTRLKKGVMEFASGKQKFNGINFGARTEIKKGKTQYKISGEQKLKAGKNYFWLFYSLNDNASLLRKVAGSCLSVKVDGKKIVPKNADLVVKKRIGVAVRDSGQDGCSSFRIPGMVATKKGTLIAIYDIRYLNSGDLSGKIDIGMSRSENGGKTWEPMKVIMTMKDYNGVDHRRNGVGDPCIVVDEKSGDIIVSALWCHGFSGLAWYSSKQGMKPEDHTGQTLVVRSSDDGKTWSKPKNITEQIKTPSWTLLLQGPGNGITLRDGTIVIPMQFQDGEMNREPFATIMWSKDGGKKWTIGNRLPITTTEAQIVELQDGSIMINSRRKSGNLRVVATTKDLGKTWELHPTNMKKEIFPISGCMSSIVRVTPFTKNNSGMLAFSGPHDLGKQRRSHFCIKISTDEGNTWSEPFMLDQVSGAYSSMAVLLKGNNKKTPYIGVLYECGRHTQLVYELVPVSEILNNKK